MIHLFNKKPSEAKSPLKATVKSQIYYILSLIAINYVLLPFIRTSHIDTGLLYGFNTAILVGGLLHMALIYYFHAKKKLPIKYIFIYALLIILIVEMPYRIMYWDITTISLPDIICRILVVTLSCLFFTLKSYFKAFPIVLALSVLVYCTFWGFSFWSHKISHGSFTGVIEQKINADMILSDSDSSEAKLSFSSDFILLDVWNTHCGVCYKAFPKLQHLYNEYADNQQINIYAVHHREKKEDYKTGAIILENEGFTFPCLSGDRDNDFLIECGVRVYPTVLILNKDKKLLFRGNLDRAVRYLEKLMSKG